MACLCCIRDPKSGHSGGARSSVTASSSFGLGRRGSSVYQIEQADTDLDGFRQKNAHQLRMQLSLTEELTKETYSLEVAKKGKEQYEAQDFFIFKEILGSGSTAVVFRAIFKPTGTMLAVKFIPNFKTAKTMVVRELQVLKLANESRFLIDYHSHFRVGQNLYFVMEICEGGTLTDLLNPTHHLPAKLMKIYLKEISSAVFFLHSLKIVHRDLSPDNLFIDSTGHLRLGDFGLCRMVWDPQGEMMTDCGKPYIKAPEIYQDKPSGFPLDWWSMGILVYRFITGYYPFKTEKLTHGYHSVTKLQEKYPEWAFVDPHAKAMCQGLLNKKPRDRLASENEEATIKNHPYFQGVNWDTKEDIIAIATNMLEPVEDVSVSSVALRLLAAIGAPVAKMNVQPCPYPPIRPMPEIGAIGSTGTSPPSPAVTFTGRFSLFALPPKGDGHDSDRKRFDDTSLPTIRETTV